MCSVSVYAHFVVVLKWRNIICSGVSGLIVKTIGEQGQYPALSKGGAYLYAYLISLCVMSLH